VTLSIEWQCEQLACAKAFPARTFGSALHTVAERKTFIVITTDDAILTFIWGVLIAINCSESARETNVLGSTSKHPIRSVTLQTQRCLERMVDPKNPPARAGLRSPQRGDYPRSADIVGTQLTIPPSFGWAGSPGFAIQRGRPHLDKASPPIECGYLGLMSSAASAMKAVLLVFIPR
jgi:hypothetical protein